MTRGRIELWSDARFADAHRLYQRFGFRPGGERELRDVNDSRECHFVLAEAVREKHLLPEPRGSQ